MPGFKFGKKYGQNKRRYRLTCEWCGVGFLSARPETNCCGNAHKLRYHRWRRNYFKMFGTHRATGPRGEVDVQNYFKPIKG
jgi:hypothetical protein